MNAGGYIHSCRFDERELCKLLQLAFHHEELHSLVFTKINEFLIVYLLLIDYLGDVDGVYYIMVWVV